MPQRFDSPPRSVCLLRLSAIGDTCHAVAALTALRTAWPETRFTWVIGVLEAKLISAILPGIEFITIDKRHMAREWLRVRALLASRRFDLLLDLQLSFRASLIAMLVRSPVKLGFDRRRARELQWLVTNAHIAPATDEHVLDSFMGFVRACGVNAPRLRWTIEVPAAALQYAERLVAVDEKPIMVISPCSSHPARNWRASRYAALADHAIEHHGFRVILAGGHSAEERIVGEAIMAASANASPRPAGTSAPHPDTAPIVNQIGKDTLPELLGLLMKARVLVSPDSGPVHMASMIDLPVIGLYAATRSARVGPYYSRQWCVDRYDEAARRYLGLSAAQVAWTTKIERPGVMDLVTVEDAASRLDALMASAAGRL